MQRQSRKPLRSCTSCLWRWTTSIPPGLLIILILFPSSAKATLEAVWEHRLLSLTANEVSRAQILQEISRCTGLEIHGIEANNLNEEVSSISFARLPLRDGLKELLADVDYVLLEERSPAGDIRSTLLLAFGHGVAAASHQADNDPAPRPDYHPDIGSPEDRIRTLSALADEGNEEALRKGISDTDPSVQATALDLLGELDRKGVIPALIQAAKSQQPETRLRALELLTNNNQVPEQTMLSMLGKAIDDDAIAVKQYVIRALAERSATGGIEYLRQALHDPDRPTRIMVIDNIVRAVPLTQRIAMLEEAALDQDQMVRDMASNWLEQLTQATRADLTNSTK